MFFDRAQTSAAFQATTAKSAMAAKVPKPGDPQQKGNRNLSGRQFPGAPSQENPAVPEAGLEPEQMGSEIPQTPKASHPLMDIAGLMGEF